MADISIKKVKRSRISLWVEKFKAADKDDKKRLITDLLFNNAMYIIICNSGDFYCNQGSGIFECIVNS